MIYAEHEGVCVSYASDSYNSHSQNLIPLIQGFLQAHKIKLTDVGTVFVITGPGSYTGIRIGVALALGLKVALKLNVIPLTLFQVYYLKYLHDDFSQLLILIDSKKNAEYYYQSLLFGESVGKSGVLPLANISDLVQDNCVISGEFSQGEVGRGVSSMGVRYSHGDFLPQLVFQNKLYLQELDSKLEAFYLNKLSFSIK